MKWSAIFRIAFVGMTALALQGAEASSAVAIDREFHITRVYDPRATEVEARERALELPVHHGWTDARILASTGRYGYCVIALAYRADGKAAVTGVFLGRPTQAEADRGPSLRASERAELIPRYMLVSNVSRCERASRSGLISER